MLEQIAIGIGVMMLAYLVSMRIGVPLTVTFLAGAAVSVYQFGYSGITIGVLISMTVMWAVSMLLFIVMLWSATGYISIKFIIFAASMASNDETVDINSMLTLETNTIIMLLMNSETHTEFSRKVVEELNAQ